MATAALAAGAAIVAAGADMEMDWHVVPGGGGSSAAGGYAVDGSAGQPAVASSAAGQYKVVGGFWAGFVGAVPPTATGTPSPGHPTTTPTLTPGAGTTAPATEVATATRPPPAFVVFLPAAVRGVAHGVWR